MRLLQAAYDADRRDHLMIVLHFWHAGRNSEIIGLTRDSIQNDRIIFPRGKGSEPCDQELVEHPNPLLNERELLFAYLRESKPGHRLFPMCRFTYLRHFKRHALAAGIPANRANTRLAKHCICTYLFETIPANKVQRRAGHKSGASTLRYAKVREAEVDQVVSGAVRL